MVSNGEILVNGQLDTDLVHVEFGFHYPDPNSLAWCIKILSGPYTGLIVKYINAAVEKGDDGKNTLSFEYEVLETPIIDVTTQGPIDLSNKNGILTHILGNILAKIVLAIAEDKANAT